MLEPRVPRFTVRCRRRPAAQQSRHQRMRFDALHSAACRRPSQQGRAAVIACGGRLGCRNCARVRRGRDRNWRSTGHEAPRCAPPATPHLRTVSAPQSRSNKGLQPSRLALPRGGVLGRCPAEHRDFEGMVGGPVRARAPCERRSRCSPQAMTRRLIVSPQAETQMRLSMRSGEQIIRLRLTCSRKNLRTRSPRSRWHLKLAIGTRILHRRIGREDLGTSRAIPRWAQGSRNLRSHPAIDWCRSLAPSTSRAPRAHRS